jgi:AbrB family looped-hinge helix DNA binding protein
MEKSIPGQQIIRWLRPVMGYVSKLTSAGQLTIPKKMREKLGLRGASLVVLDDVGDVVLLRPFEADEDTLRILRNKGTCQ